MPILFRFTFLFSLLTLPLWSQVSPTLLRQDIDVWIDKELTHFEVKQHIQFESQSYTEIQVMSDLRDWTSPSSFLHRELLNQQNIDYRFASQEEKASLEIHHSQVLNEINSRKALSYIQSIDLNYSFSPPSQHFIGEGTGDAYFAMNRPFYRPSFSKNELLEPATTAGFTQDFPGECRLQIHNPTRKHILVPNQSGLLNDTIIESLQNSREPFFVVSNQLFDFPTFAPSGDTIHWIYSSQLPPVSPTETVNRIQRYITDLYGKEIWPKTMNVLVVNTKGSLRSRPGLLIVEYSDNDAVFESRVVESFIEAFYSRVLFINELRNPWMSFGMAHYHRYDFLDKAFPNEKLLGDYSHSLASKFMDLEDIKPSYLHSWLYTYMSRQGLDQPLSDSALAFSPLNFEAIVKGKTALLLGTLRGFIGESAFRRGLSRLTRLHSGSPTTPEDFLNCFQYYANRDLSWFLGNVYTTTKRIDYDLEDIDQCSYMVVADITNHGEVAIPYSTTGFDDQGKPVLEEWHEGHLGSKQIQLHTEHYSKVILDRNHTLPDVNDQNQWRKPDGIFQRIEPIRLNFYSGLDRGSKTQIYWFPSLKFNAYDGIIGGVNFYNKSLLPKRWEYKIGPEYSTNTGSLTGMAAIKYLHPYSSGWLHALDVGLYARYYHYDENLGYARFSPSVNFLLRKSSPRSTVQQFIKLRGVGVLRELSPEDAELSNNITHAKYWVSELKYIREEQDVLRPSRLEFDIQTSAAFTKISAMYRQRYMLPNKQWLGLRLFAGSFVHNTLPSDQNFFAFGMSGTTDYLFDYSFIGRSDTSGIWSQQFFVSDGGFKTSTQAYSQKYMLSTSLNIPIWKGIGIFGDFGITPSKYYWDYGVRLCLIPDFLEVYFPIQSHQTNYIHQPAYLTSVRFILNVNQSDIIQRARRGWY